MQESGTSADRLELETMDQLYWRVTLLHCRRVELSESMYFGTGAHL